MSYVNACANPKCEHHECGVRPGDHEFAVRPNSDDLMTNPDEPKKMLRVRMVNGKTCRDVWFCERCAEGVKAFLNA